MRSRTAQPAGKGRKVSPQGSVSFPLQVSPVLSKSPADRQRARIILISGGTGSFEAGRRTQEVSIGHVVILSPGYAGRFVRPANLQMRVLSLDVPAFRAQARHWDIARSANFKALFPFAVPRPRRGASAWSWRIAGRKCS